MTTSNNKTNQVLAPRWMAVTLKAAGIYNILWGAWVSLFPLTFFQWVGMDLPRYPMIWQCVGMIVGVYGLGYYIAAYNPYRHWPIILVGFLGKVLGPIGMLWYIATGVLEPAFALHNITNDLIWLVPFGIILYRAYKAATNG